MKNIVTINAFLNTLIPALITALATYIAYLKSVRLTVHSELYKERLFKFYYPAFKTLEPYMFEKIDKENALTIYNNLITLVTSNPLLINDRIIDRLELMERNLANNDNEYQNDFYSICKHIDTDLTLLQSKLGLPVRGFIYRLNHKQLTVKSFLTSKVFREFFIEFFIPLFIFICFAYSLASYIR